MYDFIGDIHGHADELKKLLQKLGYELKNEVYEHPERKVIFVGDYIDRGSQIREVLQLVRGMVEAGNAIALMGNHEYNALCFHVEESKGGHVRKHLIKNIIQHFETLRQFQNRQNEYEDYLKWFKTLPLFYEDAGFRVVHACWDSQHIALLKQTLVNNCLTDDLIHESVKADTPFYDAINDTLKGREIKMPEGLHFTDKDGNIRTEIRIKWWEDLLRSTYKSISVIPLEMLPEIPIDTSKLKNTRFYKSSDKPVFFGHYWLKGQPSLYRDNVCCLDYSVAKGGSLVAYRFDGERSLHKGKLVWV
jgi:hypothetical protein